MEILGLSTSPSSGGAYALILSEANGSRRLPIVIGSYEAQAIALELENIKPPRPMTHDLLKNVILSFDTSVKHVYINDLEDGTFYAQIIYDRDGHTVEIDARPSDAIALSVRFGTPIYVNEDILEEAGINTDPEAEAEHKTELVIKSSSQPEFTKIEDLEKELKTAIETENYEKAAKIRDSIQKMKG